MKQHQILSLAIISLLFISTPKTLLSQTQKGNLLVEGNLGNFNLISSRDGWGSSQNTGKIEYTSYAISVYPRIGYFLTDNIVLGTTLNYRYQLDKQKHYWIDGLISSSGKSNRSSLGLSPFLRYYFTKNSKNRFYGQVSGGINIYLFDRYEGTTYNDTGEINGTFNYRSKGQTLTGEALIGFNHFFTTNVAFNSSIGYTYYKEIQKTTYNSSESKSTIQISNVSWNFGFTISIARKKVN